MPLTYLAAMLLAVSTAAPTTTTSIEWRTLDVDGTVLEYAFATPKDFDPAVPYPVLIALPPGPQTREMVEAGLGRYWGNEATRRDWVVVSPVAPGTGTFFHTGGERLIPALLRHLRQTLTIEGSRFHLAGASNGGRSAFRVATSWPIEFQSLTVLPGFPPEDSDRERLRRLVHIPVRLFVGGEDTPWLERTRETETRLRELGLDVEVRVLDGEGHVPPSLDGGAVMDVLEALHAKGRRTDPTEAALVAALDDFNDAAGKADAARYFGAFAPEGVFLGTDGAERWPLAEFREWAKPHFTGKTAWLFIPQVQHVHVTEGGNLAWFDEVVGSHHYGACRGTGVLRKIGGTWKVAQYNLTVPIPNDLLGRVVDSIRAFEDGIAAGVTRVFLVRHAEKIDAPGDRDPGLDPAGIERAAHLARALRSVHLTAVFASEYQRTALTAAAVAKPADLPVTVVSARESRELADIILRDHRGRNVLVAGHSNTVPAIIAALGVTEPIAIDDTDYDNLFLVEISERGAQLIRLHYGE